MAEASEGVPVPLSRPELPKLVIKSKHLLLPGPTNLQLLLGRCRLGEHMFMSNWSVLMTPQKANLTACVHFRDSYPIEYRRLSSQFEVYLSAAALGMYLCGINRIS